MAGGIERERPGGRGGKGRKETSKAPDFSLNRKRLKVLVAEDQAEIRTLIEVVLQGMEVEVEVTDTAEEGIKKLRAAKDLKDPFDLTLTDHGLAGKKKGAALAVIAKKEGLCESVDMLTGNEGLTNRLRDPQIRRKIGVNSVTLKPFDVGVIIDLVEKARESKYNK